MRILLVLALLFASTIADARAVKEMVEIKAGEPVAIKPDRAYILFRVSKPKGVTSVEPVFMRIPTAREMALYWVAKAAAFAKDEADLIREREDQLRKKAAAEVRRQPFKEIIPPPPTVQNYNFVYKDVHNLQSVDHGHEFVKGSPDSVYLVEVLPGDYILYGASYGASVPDPSLHMCLCLGTVGFAAKPGVITDLGYFLGDSAKTESELPELRPESGFGPSSDPFFPLLVATIRPVRPDTFVPAGLEGTKIVPADYHAVGKFFNPNASGINRLVPVPGVLAYDNGRVIDVKTGKPAPDTH